MSGGEHRNPDSTNVYAVAVIAGVSTFLVWASIVGLRAYFGNTYNDVAKDREVAGQEAIKLALKAEQLAQLEPKGVEYSDEAKTRVRIPIEVAEELVLETLGENAGATTVPLVGEHDVANIPAVPGRPMDNPPATPAPTPAPAPEVIAPQPTEDPEPTEDEEPTTDAAADEESPE